MRTFNIMAVLFLNVFVSQAQIQPSPRLEATRLIHQGDNQMKFGNWEQAILTYTNAIYADPSYAEAYMKRAALYERTGRQREAMQDYEAAIRMNPYSEYIYDRRARLKLLAMDYKGALNDINEAISINPYSSELIEHRVEDLLALEEYEAALEDIDTLISQGYEVYHQLERRALVFILMNDLVSAEKELLNLGQELGYSATAFDLMGLIKLLQKDFEGAISAFSSAVELDPDFSMAWYNRALAHRYAGNDEAAIDDLNTALSNCRKPDKVFFARALVRKEMGDLDGAFDDYTSAIADNKNHSEALYNRTYIHKLMGEYSKARIDAEKILEIDSSSPEHWNLLGNVEVLHGNFNTAIEHYSKAIIRDQSYAEAWYNRGIAYLMSYRLVQGCEDLQRSVDLGYEAAAELMIQFCGN